MNSLEKFILEHQHDDISKLLLAKKKSYDFDFNLAVNTIEARKSIKYKVEEWYKHSSLLYPSILSAQQCSSQSCAQYKANICKRLSIKTIADLCAGLGVDSYFFSKVVDTLVYNEQQEKIYACAMHNFKELRISNVLFKNIEINADSLEKLLSEAAVDMVFLDPARRDKSGKKVFLLEDCSPNILQLQDIILKHCPYLLLKLSPMADLQMLRKQCRNISEMHIVSHRGECKEILLVLTRNKTQKEEVLFLKDEHFCLRLEKEEIDGYKAEYISSIQELKNAKYLFEPSKSILKSGLFNLPCTKFSLKKLAVNTHLYVSEQETDNFACYGKTFKILEVLSISKEACKYIKKSYPYAEITAKSVHLSSEQFKNKLGLKSSETIHIFAVETSKPLTSFTDKVFIICQCLKTT